MKTTPFQNVEYQLGFCGIWCGSCPAGNGSIVELTRRYATTIKQSNLENWAPPTFDFTEFMKGLAALQTVPLCDGCLKGGGNPTCTIRLCARQKNIPSCSQCEALPQCTHFASLERRNPHIKTELSRLKDRDPRELINTWTMELKERFPHCLLLCRSK